MAKKNAKSTVIVIASIVALVAIIGGSVLTFSLISAMSGSASTSTTKRHDDDDDDDETKKTTAETKETEPAITNPAVPDDAADWTVLMYVCGTDLESSHGFASGVFDYIDDFPISDKINVIAETGGALKWNNNDARFSGDKVQSLNIPTNKLGRYKFEGHDIVEIEKVDLQSMGSSKTLSDFISWGVKEYPAKKYMLVIWDHGYVEPYGNLEHDQIFYQDANGNPVNSQTGADVSKLVADNLNLDEYRQALQTAGIKFEMVTFNTCLSASVEIASATAPYANYMVASEESIPAVIGIPYDFLQFIMDNPDADGKAVGKNIIENYQKQINYYTDKYNNQQEAVEFFSKGTMSLIDLSCMPEFDKYMAEIWKNLYESTYDAATYSAFQTAASYCETYGSEGNAPGNLVDLKGFLKNASTQLVNTDADENLIRLIDTYITYGNGKSRYDSNGISFFFPSSSYINGIKANYQNKFKINGYDCTEDELNNLCKSYVSTSFKGYVDNIDFIDGYYWYVAYLGHRFGDYYQVPADIKKTVEENRDPNVTPAPQITNEPQKIDYTIDFDQKGNITLTINSGADTVVDVQTAMVLYASASEDTSSFSYFGNDTTDHDASKPGVYTKKYDAEWFRFNNIPVHMFITENTNSYTSYSMPAQINGKWAYILFQKEKSTGKFSIAYCYYADPNTGIATNEMFNLKVGDKIEPLYYSLMFTNDTVFTNNPEEGVIWIRTRENTEIIYDGTNDNMVYERFINPKSDEVILLYSFLIKDAFGNTYHTSSVELIYKYGKLTSVKQAEGYKDYSEIVNAISDEV